MHAIGWDPTAAPVRQGTKVRAFGPACVIKGAVTPSTSTASVKLNEDGSLDILTSSVEMGQGLQTAMAIIAARRIGVPVNDIHVSEVDTDVTPYDQQTSSSRSTHAMGSAVALALDEIREQLLDLGADQLEADRADLEVAGGQVRVKGATGPRPQPVARWCAPRGVATCWATARSRARADWTRRRARASARSTGTRRPARPRSRWTSRPARSSVLRYQAAVYAGRIINPVQAELQTEGSVAFGLGQALFEEMVFDGGQLQNGNLGEYMIASIEDMPRNRRDDPGA